MKNKLLKNTEWSVLIYSLILFAIGAVALFSATQSTELAEFKKQLQWFAVSIPFLVLAATIDYNVITRFSPIVYIIFIGLLVGVLFTEPINGATSWYQITDSLSFQPSELAKIIYIMFMAYVVNKLQMRGKDEINKPWKLLIAISVAVVPLLLIIKQPDFGTALAYITATVFMIFAAGIDKKYIIAVVAIIIIAAPVIYGALPEHALKRINVFLDPESDARGAGYNVIQSKLAIGAGKIFGMGLLKGNQTQLGFLHPKTTDFIFSVIGEELGFVATGTIVILYTMLITKAIFIAKTAKDNVGAYIAIGIAGILSFHMIENIGMTIGLLPITGVPLPFVSYGGSSLITNFIFIGMLLNISARRQKSIFVE